ncbi:hypothetical protein Moror_15088 [Moniliophthora roreri MCA 2997]|uniref:BTB domain-containing protein n=1 Tax=Moniliophthora roreri (strain MCA 2997) TaxID=1381753 RepID=V2XV29_MONRO|nr:hypothetical protein Moror_15088 [Moniliophthora roreri MCA 2997]
MSSPTPIPTVASAPFDAADADVILRTSDNVDFYFYRLILSLVSPFFKDMFTLPNPATPDGKDDKKNETHVIPVSEDSVTLDHTLRFVYPGIEPPVLSTWEEVEPVFETFIKYQMEETAPFSSILSCLLQTAGKAPATIDTTNDRHAQHWRAYSTMRVLAKVEKYKDSLPEGTTTDAMERALMVPFFELMTAFVEDLEGWSAKDFIRLMKRHRSQVLEQHIPSFQSWKDDDARWTYRCYAATAGNVSFGDSLKLDRKQISEWYASSLVPSLQRWETLDMTLFSYEPSTTCLHCNRVHCSYMVNASAEIYRAEIGRALSVCLVLSSKRNW